MEEIAWKDDAHQSHNQPTAIEIFKKRVEHKFHQSPKS